MKTADVIVIGGGLSGSAIALGLMQNNAGTVILFDEQLMLLIVIFLIQ